MSNTQELDATRLEPAPVEFTDMLTEPKAAPTPGRPLSGSTRSMSSANSRSWASWR